MPLSSQLITLLLLIAATLFSVANGEEIELSTSSAPNEFERQIDPFNNNYEGQIWLAKMSTPLSRWIKDEDARVQLLTLIYTESEKHGLEPGLVLALIQVESAFDHYAISHAGARGMMQIMPFWKAEIGTEEDNLMDLTTNIQYGTTILSHYIALEKGSLIKALARYNGSRGQTWYPKRVLTYWHKHWRVGE